MKKLIIILVVVLTVLTACSTDSGKDNGSDTAKNDPLQDLKSYIEQADNPAKVFGWSG